MQVVLKRKLGLVLNQMDMRDAGVFLHLCFNAMKCQPEVVSISVKRMAEALRFHPITVKGALDHLEEMGLVQLGEQERGPNAQLYYKIPTKYVIFE
jgi:hypothetical protein